MSSFVEIGGVEYRIGKLDAREQLHVVRRVGPLLTPLASVVASGLRDGRDGKQLAARALESPELLAQFLQSLADLPDERLDYVLDKCLAVVHRRAGEAFVAAYDSRTKRANAEEANDLWVLLQLTGRVIVESLQRFFSALPTGQSGQTSPPKTA